MAEIALLTGTSGPLANIWPALDLLPHRVTVLSADTAALLALPRCDAVVLDARRDLVAARRITQLLAKTGPPSPILLLVTEGALSALSGEWGVQDFILAEASPAEVDARLRLAISAANQIAGTIEAELIVCGDLTIDPVSYTARLRHRPLDLAYKEFELLRFLAAHPGRVFTREQLLQEVWGYDYYGGTRTVDVHVRRLRAKIGVEHEQMIGTVRNVGYRMNQPAER